MLLLVQAYLPIDMQAHAESIASTLKKAMLGGSNSLKDDDICVVVIPSINNIAVITVASEGIVSRLRRKTYKDNLADGWERFLRLWPGFKRLGMKIFVFGEQMDLNPYSMPI